MKLRSNPFVAIPLALISATSLHGASLFWNANSGLPDYTGDWDTFAVNWNSATAGGGTPSAWITDENAVFDVAGSHLVTLLGAQSASSLDIKAGTVTLAGVAGTDSLATSTITIDSGATLSGAGDLFLKTGTTALTVNGTLDYLSLASTARKVSIAGGSGSIILGAGMRIGGAITFAGNISGGSAGALVTDAGGIIALSGNNTYSGESLIRSANTLRLGSATALSSNSFVRTGGGCIFELTGTDFSRELALSGGGKMRIGNTADVTASTFGFSAVNADRSVALTGSVLWGSTTFNPSVFNLGTAASTHKVTLTTGIDLNAASRTVNSTNGSAEVEGEISGVISGAAGSILTKTGTGVLLLSNSNTHPGGTVIAQSQGAINPLRISHSNAAGPGSLTIGAGGNNDQSRLELTGGITVANTIPSLTSRNNDVPHIVNVSGNNTISSNISAGGGGSRTTFESAADKLVFGGTVSVRQLNLFGAGDGEISGSVTIASTYILNKAGAGKWTIGGNMSNGTGTTIASGTLQIGKGGGTGSLGIAPITNNGALIFDRTGAVTIPGAISGSGTITKRGTSAITLSGATIEHGGATAIEDGSLLVTGNATNATGAVTVGDGIGDAKSAVLGGTGPIGGSITLDSDGAIAPGTSAGTLTASANVSGDGALLIEMDGATADQLVVGGALDISAMTLDLSTINAPTENVYVIVDASSNITGAQFAAVTGSIPGYTVTYNYNDGVDTHNIALIGAPVSSPYETWATTNGVTGQAADLDHDNDGVSNGVECFLVGPNTVSTGFNALPGVTTVAGVRSITWTKAASYTGVYGTGFFVETSTTLAPGSWATETTSPGNVSISGNNVTYTFPAGPVKTFARLRVTGP